MQKVQRVNGGLLLFQPVSRKSLWSRVQACMMAAAKGRCSLNSQKVREGRRSGFSHFWFFWESSYFKPWSFPSSSLGNIYSESATRTEGKSKCNSYAVGLRDDVWLCLQDIRCCCVTWQYCRISVYKWLICEGLLLSLTCLLCLYFTFNFNSLKSIKTSCVLGVPESDGCMDSIHLTESPDKICN